MEWGIYLIELFPLLPQEQSTQLGLQMALGQEENLITLTADIVSARIDCQTWPREAARGQPCAFFSRL